MFLILKGLIATFVLPDVEVSVLLFDLTLNSSVFGIVMKFELRKKRSCLLPLSRQRPTKTTQCSSSWERRQLYFDIKQLSRYKISTTLHLLMLVFGVDCCKDTRFFINPNFYPSFFNLRNSCYNTPGSLNTPSPYYSRLC